MSKEPKIPLNQDMIFLLQGVVHLVATHPPKINGKIYSTLGLEKKVVIDYYCHVTLNRLVLEGVYEIRQTISCFLGGSYIATSVHFIQRSPWSPQLLSRTLDWTRRRAGRKPVKLNHISMIRHHSAWKSPKSSFYFVTNRWHYKGQTNCVFAL